jgi:hypothetical protein
MMDLPIIPLFGPFGGNQMIVAMSTTHPEARTTCGRHLRHGKVLPAWIFWVARRSKNNTTIGIAATHLNFIDRERNFS